MFFYLNIDLFPLSVFIFYLLVYLWIIEYISTQKYMHTTFDSSLLKRLGLDFLSLKQRLLLMSWLLRVSWKSCRGEVGATCICCVD